MAEMIGIMPPRLPSGQHLNLQNMPNPVLENIMKHVGFLGVVHLRKTCRNLLYYVDNNSIPVSLGFVKIRVRPEIIFVEWDQFMGMTTEYTRDVNGCIVRKRQNFKYFPGEDYVDKFLRDLQINFVKNKVTITDFEVIIENLEDNHPFLLKFPALLSTQKKQMKVEFLTVRIRIPRESLIILPFVKPGYLSKLALEQSEGIRGILDFSTEDITEIGNLEQWKQTKQLWGFRNIIPSSTLAIRYFSHFNTLYLTVSDLYSEDLVRIKELVSSPATSLTSASFTFREFHTPERFAQLLGPQHNDEDSVPKWRFETDDNILEIEWDEYIINIKSTQKLKDRSIDWVQYPGLQLVPIN